ncbi:MAG: hypothetical protein P8O76_05880 [Methylophilaceae bacterium]|nr:hypothetical protein [Methylophilaceae bacterium]MDG1444971.1 hypothetical protein [Methylophilaceae bacterium]MDG1821208.1 hypothetical protein [Methylophilaceae bacterium]MDG2292989.1 hypothetical protein [Methylophilaceae bacterium]
MYLYPILTRLEQADLPRLISAPTALARQFSDSTHQVFHCDTVDGSMVLKICDDLVVAKSSFWQVANHLFGADFPKSLTQIHHTHQLLTQHGLYMVPDFVVASRRSFEHQFVCTRLIAGEALTTAPVTEKMVIQLAQHIACLHQQTQSTWGNLHKPSYQANEWGGRLHASLSALAAKSKVAIPQALLAHALAQASAVQETEFVPMMLDLRWDQFRRLDKAQETLALIDLDAFVIAPRTLDLILLAYILTPSQYTLFKARYTECHYWPDDSVQKSCYQLLLFLMQILGETNLAQWMQSR